MPGHESTQPSSTPAMSAKPEMQQAAKSVGLEYAKSFAKEGGKETAQYEATHASQQAADAKHQLDDMQAQAQGLWAKFCGCFSGV